MTAAIGVEDPHREDGCVRGHRREQPRHERAVADEFVGETVAVSIEPVRSVVRIRVLVDEVDAAEEPGAGERNVRGVNAGVQQRDGHALPARRRVGGVEPDAVPDILSEELRRHDPEIEALRVAARRRRSVVELGRLDADVRFQRQLEEVLVPPGGNVQQVDAVRGDLIDEGRLEVDEDLRDVHRRSELHDGIQRRRARPCPGRDQGDARGSDQPPCPCRDRGASSHGPHPSVFHAKCGARC